MNKLGQKSIYFHFACSDEASNNHIFDLASKIIRDPPNLSINYQQVAEKQVANC